MTRRVVVYTRAGCGLCATAEAVAARVCAELGHDCSTVDVDAEPALRAEFGDRVPVIEIDGREHGYFRIEEERFRAALGG